jgi:NADH-quinone oxidoreductase subunit G
MLEFTLVNHPIDCPICDKAGECALQRLYMEWDATPSRIDHPKVRKGKRLDIGPRIVLDQERCILCTRCVRFCEEVAKSPQLVIAERGNHSLLTTAPGHRLDNPYSLNTVDVCPVGALTDKDFRFQVRVWNLTAVQSVCNGCATGCRCEIHSWRNRIYRLVPPRVKDIDESWMCDYGRYTYKAVASERLLAPAVDGKPASWDDALARVAALLSDARGSDGAGPAAPAPLQGDARAAIGVVLGADATNEDNFVAARLAFDFLQLGHVYLAAEPDTTEGDAILRAADPNPNRTGAVACARGKLRSAAELAADLAEGKLRALHVVGDRLYLPGEAIERARKLELLAVQATHPSALTRAAHVVLPACMWEEVDGTVTNGAGLVQRLRAGVRPPEAARPHWEILVRLARRLGLTLEHAGPRAIFEQARQELELLRDAEWGEELAPVWLRFAGTRG